MSELAGEEIISFKTGLAAAWTAANPILTVSEPGVESDTRKWKLGDGTTHWNDLPYQTTPTWANIEGAPDFPDFIAAGDTAPLARAAVGALGAADAWDAMDKPDFVGAGDTAEDARAVIGAYGESDKDVPGGIPGLDVDGHIDPARIANVVDLSDYATLDDLGVPIDSIATGVTSNLAAALSSVDPADGVDGFIAVLVG
jgi:hypothetical protein